MKLYIKQKIFTIGDKFDIYDEWQHPVYNVEAQLLSFPRKLHLYDNSGLEVFLVQRQFTWFLAKYEIYSAGMQVATIEQQFSFPSKEFSITAATGDQFTIEGDMFGWTFSIMKNGLPYASLSKRLMAWGDSYEINVFDDRELAFAAAIVIALDNCLHNGKRDNTLF